MKRPGVSALLMCVALSPALPARADHPGAGFGQTISGPIVTIPASTLPASRWAASLRYEWVTFETFSDAELLALAADGEEIHSVDELIAPSFTLAYGFSDRLTVGAQLPHVTRREIREGHLEGGVPEVHDHGDSRGPGDLSILAQIRGSRASSRPQYAILLGVKVPTGDTGERTEDGVLFEVEHQPGTGSVDPLVGVAWSFGLPSVHIDANVLGTIATKGKQQTRLGSLVGINVAASWRMSGAGHGRRANAKHAHVDLITEVNGEWRSRTEIADVEEPNSGGTLAYFTPGFRVLTPAQWSLSGAVGIPFLQDLHGVQHETRLRAIASLGVLF